MRPQLNGGTLGRREACGTLNSELDQIIRCVSLEAAMRLAETAVASGSPIWSDRAWLTVASCANSRAISDPAWLALCIFAHERRTVEVAVVDALVKRARLIAERGPADTDSFRDPEHFFNGVRRFINGESSPSALESFRFAVNVVFTADRQSPEWGHARLQFIRARRLRELGQALRSVSERGVSVPLDLAEWLAWAEVREVEGRIVT